MILAELEIWHSRPITPTRRVSLGHLMLPADPAPGFGGILLGAVVARHLFDVDEEMHPDIHRLTLQVERGERIVQPRPRIVSIEKRGKHARILVAHRAELCELLSRKPIRRDRLVEITTREFAVLGHIVEILAVVGAQETRDMTHLLADIARALETFARGRPSRARDFTEIRAQLRNAPPANRARSNHERYGGERDERNICCDLHG